MQLISLGHRGPKPSVPPPTDARLLFDRITPFTVGVEEELLLVDDVTFAPLSAAHAAIAACPSRRLHHELRACQLESVTPICATTAGAAHELAVTRAELANRLPGIWAVGAGTHPLAQEPGEVSVGTRYRELAATHPWARRHTLTSGLHVHVAVGGAARSVAVHDALRSYLPEVLALGANAPFYRGEDSGLATVRPKLNQAWPRSGVPPAFGTWDEFEAFIDWSRDGGAFPDGSHQWWDLRLNLSHGTIEVRVADCQSRVEDAAAIAALVQSLVVELADRYEATGELPVHAGERIGENLWLATRDGIGARLIELETGRPVAAADRLLRLVEELLPTARKLGCDAELLDVARIVEAGGGAERQRRAYAAGGVPALFETLAGDVALALPVGAVA